MRSSGREIFGLCCQDQDDLQAVAIWAEFLETARETEPFRSQRLRRRKRPEVIEMERKSEASPEVPLTLLLGRTGPREWLLED